MKEILKEILQKVELSKTLHTIADKGIEKLVASAVGATLWDLATIYVLLIVLIVVDIFTHCIYEASKLYKNMYDKKIVAKCGGLLTYIKYLNHAHKFHGYIDSYLLRDGFWNKVICYFLLIVQSGRNTSALSGYVIINDNGLHGFNGLSKMLINSVDKIR